MSTIHRTIITPIVTEQSSSAYQDRGEYTFSVAPGSSKTAIRTAVEQLFGVKVVGVWTSNHRGKARTVGRMKGRRPHWKKAIVRLKAGDTIDIFEA